MDKFAIRIRRKPSGLPDPAMAERLWTVIHRGNVLTLGWLQESNVSGPRQGVLVLNQSSLKNCHSEHREESLMPDS